MTGQAKIYIGTSGWSYPKGEGTWTGYFYPTGNINEFTRTMIKVNKHSSVC